MLIHAIKLKTDILDVDLRGSSPIKQSREQEQKYKLFPKVSGLLKMKVFGVECKSVAVTHVGSMTIKRNPSAARQ